MGFDAAARSDLARKRCRGEPAQAENLRRPRRHPGTLGEDAIADAVAQA
jgi:hypothetical protein